LGGNPIGPDGDGRGEKKAGGKWFARKKHRAVAKMEFEDAFELRDRLVWVLGMVFVVTLVLLLVGLRKLLMWFGT